MKKVLFFTMFASAIFAEAAEKADQFKKLEQSFSNDPSPLIAILLKPYGNVSDFKLFDESIVSEVCLNKTVIRANVTCNKKEQHREQQLFAEGKELLCLISGNFKEIKCLPKPVAEK